MITKIHGPPFMSTEQIRSRISAQESLVVA